MIYGSVCSGIEAATVAWEPLGWMASFFSEIETFPRAVLRHHYPDVPLHGDFTTIQKGEYNAIQLLVGGTPCQDFSVAGLRKGIKGDRGNLTLEFVRLAQRLSPQWIVWENVPGVLSIDEGRAFGAFLGGLAECGYGFAYRILDAQYFGVPQRRRRVFVIGHFGDWRPAAQVLFEPESLHGNPAPRREAGKDVAGTFKACAGSGSWNNSADYAAAGYIIPDVAGCLQERDAKGADSDTKPGHLIPIPINTQVATRHKALGERTAFGIGNEGDPSFTFGANHSHAVAFGGDVARTLSARHDSSPCADRGMDVVSQNTQVRRLTPIECERLMGFPDDYTKITTKTADSPRYKALGNSMAVPVMRWIGERIEAVSSRR